MAEEMTSAELMEWAAYEQVAGPIVVHERVDIAAAIIGTLIARLGGDKRTRPEDLIPKWGTTSSPADGWSALERMARKSQP